MAKIIAPEVPKVGQEIVVRIDSPTRIGNAIGIFVDGVRSALGRVNKKYDDDPKFTFPLHGHSGEVHSAHHVFGVRVETIFGDED